MNIIYLRVSKEDETAQDLEAQLPPILKKYNIKEYKLIKDRGSAYNTDKIKNRTGFLEILDIITKGLTIKDLFIHKNESETNLYIFDYNRLFRSIEYGLLFSIICSLLNVKVYSVNQEDLNEKPNENIGEKIGRYIRLAMYSFLAEGYSKNISDHTKKAFTNLEDAKGNKSLTKYSKYGNAIGNKLKTIEGANAKLTPTQLIGLEEEIINLARFKPYKRIVEIIRDKHAIRISESYISKLKQKDLNTK